MTAKRPEGNHKVILLINDHRRKLLPLWQRETNSSWKRNKLL